MNGKKNTSYTMCSFFPIQSYSYKWPCSIAIPSVGAESWALKGEHVCACDDLIQHPGMDMSLGWPQKGLSK